MRSIVSKTTWWLTQMTTIVPKLMAYAAYEGHSASRAWASRDLTSGSVTEKS